MSQKAEAEMPPQRPGADLIMAGAGEAGQRRLSEREATVISVVLFAAIYLVGIVSGIMALSKHGS